MKKIIITSGLILLYCNFSLAQVDEKYQQTLQKMFHVSGSEEAYKTVLKEMIKMFKEMSPDADEEIWQEMEKEFLKTSMNELAVLLVPVYEKYMSLEDLEEIILFYQSPVGKKLAKSTPSITQESMQVGQQWGMAVGEMLEKRLQEKKYYIQN